MDVTIEESSPLKGELLISGDKSISHRAVLFSALARGESRIQNFLFAADTISTYRCVEQLGARISQQGSTLLVMGKGLDNLKEAEDVLDCGNSGTTMRLLAGLLAGCPFVSILNGDSSLRQRPMHRIVEPLKKMGAEILARNHGKCAPLAIKGHKLKGIEYRTPVASAQVKSCLLLAGLRADSCTILTEPEKSRDHTERMLAAMGANIQVDGLNIRLSPGFTLQPREFFVPGDFSSAAFFIVAATIVPGSEILIKGLGLNPTRTGLLQVLLRMGASIKVENLKTIGGETIADLIVKSSSLKGTTVEGDMIPQLIDEIPVLAVAMAVAIGPSIVKDAGELRVKETDRIRAICSEYSKIGVNISEQADGFIIEGSPDILRGAAVDSYGDHRIAMSLAVAALRARGATTISNAEAVSISYPDFWENLAMLQN